MYATVWRTISICSDFNSALSLTTNYSVELTTWSTLYENNTLPSRKKREISVYDLIGLYSSSALKFTMTYFSLHNNAWNALKTTPYFSLNLDLGKREWSWFYPTDRRYQNCQKERDTRNKYMYERSPSDAVFHFDINIFIYTYIYTYTHIHVYKYFLTDFRARFFIFS